MIYLLGRDPLVKNSTQDRAGKFTKSNSKNAKFSCCGNNTTMVVHSQIKSKFIQFAQEYFTRYVEGLEPATSGPTTQRSTSWAIHTIYKTSLNKDLNFFLCNLKVTGPKRYFDLKSCLFRISIELLLLNLITNPSFLTTGNLPLITNPLQMSPFLLNLNLNPLYSIRGGSTIRAEPLTKKPTGDWTLIKPL